MNDRNTTNTEKKKPFSDGLIGAGLLSFRNGAVHEQGTIVSIVHDANDTYVIVQFSEWMMGDPTYARLVSIKDILFDPNGKDMDKVTYRLFHDNDERNSYYEWKTHKGREFEKGAR